MPSVFVSVVALKPTWCSGAARADLCARFSLKDTPAALRWLKNTLKTGMIFWWQRDRQRWSLPVVCINGTAVPLSQLRELGQLLIRIHGQHAHQLLTKPEHQKFLLDGYANETSLLQEMTARYQLWHQRSCRDLAHHQQLSQERAARAGTAAIPIKRTNEFNPQPGEFEQIDEEYKRLANSGQLLTTSQNALALMADGEDANLQSQLYTAKQLVSELIGMDSKLSAYLICWKKLPSRLLKPATNCATTAIVWISIPTGCLKLNNAYSKQISLARKHHVSPEALPQYYQSLLEEQQQLDDQADSQETLALAVTKHHQQALETARALHQQRQHYAERTAQLITDSTCSQCRIGQFTIDVKFDEHHLGADGADRIEFG